MNNLTQDIYKVMKPQFNDIWEEVYYELSNFKQRYLLSKLKDGKMVHYGVQIHSNGISLNDDIELIKGLELLIKSNYLFKITGDTNSETITIK